MFTLIFLLAILVPGLPFDVYPYYQPPVPGNMATISIWSQCFSDDQVYMGIAGAGSTDPLQVFIKGAAGY
jgi:hypothetical protein